MTKALRTLLVASIGLGLVSLAVSISALAVAGPAARDVMQETVVEVVAILKDSSKDQLQRRKELEQIAYRRFDFRTMSRLVLAKNWKRLSKDQQKEFETEFRAYLANDYGSRLDRYGDEEVEIVGERKEAAVGKRPPDITIKTEIKGGDSNGALVDYRMRNRQGNWKIIDVVIEGISLIANFRDQFREVISSGGPEGLIDKLKEKNAANQA